VASTKFEKRNLNRYRKVYPYLRREPRYELISTTEALIEVAAVTFNNSIEETYTFEEFFIGTPRVTATVVDSSGKDTADTNVYISSLNSSRVILQTTGLFSGTVHLHIIYLGS